MSPMRSVLGVVAMPSMMRWSSSTAFHSITLYARFIGSSDEQQVVRRCGFLTDCHAQTHDRSNNAIDAACDLGLVRLDVARWVGTYRDVAHHPVQHGAVRVPHPAGHNQPLELLARLV